VVGGGTGGKAGVTLIVCVCVLGEDKQVKCTVLTTDSVSTYSVLDPME
jgi:hypothetical protein